jgi:hypothetical protein
LDEKLVWSVIYEETYFQGWKIGAADEVGLMQVTPTVAREWAKETGFREFENKRPKIRRRIFAETRKKYSNRLLVSGKSARKNIAAFRRKKR